ncbi:MAG: DNA-processing protein DprA, partial [Tissierellia bacterium]|nr:DNA-processing protein DprA [Tissierellia bacterium]
IGKLKNYFGSVSEVFQVSRTILEKSGTLSDKTISRIVNNKDLDMIKKIMDDYERHNISIYIPDDEDYPEPVRKIDDAPWVLYCKGSYQKDDPIAIAVVGSRKCSNYGKQVCSHITSELAKMGITIVSGLAYGIDAIAHENALKHDGRTLAVLGTGINVIHPKRNAHLFHKIPEQGCILTEFPANTEGKAWNFPRRNRIISGLSLGVLVIEAQAKSGSLITAGFAGEQGKEVFAVPGNIISPYSQGTNKLIQDGAKLVMDVDDILEELSELSTIKKTESPSENFYDDLSPMEYKVVEVLQQGEYTLDYIANQLEVPIQEAQVIITMLELKDVIQCTAGGTYVLMIRKRK